MVCVSYCLYDLHLPGVPSQYRSLAQGFQGELSLPGEIALPSLAKGYLSAKTVGFVLSL